MFSDVSARCELFVRKKVGFGRTSIQPSPNDYAFVIVFYVSNENKNAGVETVALTVWCVKPTDSQLARKRQQVNWREVSNEPSISDGCSLVCSKEQIILPAHSKLSALQVGSDVRFFWGDLFVVQSRVLY